MRSEFSDFSGTTPWASTPPPTPPTLPLSPLSGSHGYSNITMRVIRKAKPNGVHSGFVKVTVTVIVVVVVVVIG